MAYWVDPNAGTNSRTGSITVGGHDFPIFQAGQHWVWNARFGWLYEAGSGWYGGSALGWMWFSPSEWIWSSSLQGWLGIVDDSPTLWSPQFRWFMLSSPFDGTVRTSTLGWIAVGDFAGWVWSLRFGWVWANGDGVWFWATDYGWLGVTPDGGIWCVKENRFL